MKKTHYDKKYFDWQKIIGEFGGRVNLEKFEKHINKNHKVIDFGCGGGYLLSHISCAEKIGIEPNPHARKSAEEIGIKSLKNGKSIEDSWADIIISNNVLEHVDNPFEELKLLRKKLKKGGSIIFITPCDSQSKSYNAGDINKHLFSWSPMNLGNLFTRAGFKTESVEPYLHKWPPFFIQIEKIFGLRIFHIIAKIYGFIVRDWIQVKIIAKK